MNLPDPAASRAVLIGTSIFDHLEDLPAVRNNIAAIAQCLTDEQLWGLHPDNLTTVLDPVRPEDILAPIDDAAEAASDTLIVYYAGHGLVDSQSNLLLATKGSTQRKAYTAASYDAIRAIVVDGRAQRRVVILDCCFSGRALGTMAGAAELADVVAQSADAEGTFVLAAAAENKSALAPPNETYTAFTGELVKLLNEGHPGAPALWNLDSLYLNLRDVLRSRGRPEPQKRERNNAGRLCIARNRAKIRAPAHNGFTPEPGAVLAERHRLTRVLRTGGSGQLWEAFDIEHQRTVALRIFSSEFSDEPGLSERFRGIARTAAIINHPCVVNVYEYGETDVAGTGRVGYVVSQLVDGEPLSVVLERGGGLPLASALDILEQAAHGLQASQDGHIASRFLTPDSILVTATGQAILTDGIGAAVRAASGHPPVDAADARYLPPEYAEAKRGPASDVYALGVIACEALAQRRPSNSDGRPTAAPTQADAEAAPLHDDVPPQVRELIAQMLARNPALRHGGGRQLADAVAAVRRGRRPPSPAVTASRTRPGLFVAWPYEANIEIYGATCRKELAVEGAPVYGLAFSPDGLRLVSRGGDPTVHLWDPFDGLHIGQLGDHQASALGFSPDGQLLAVGSQKLVRVWDHTDSTVIATLAGHTSLVTCVAFSPDGSLIATGSADATVRLWDAASATAILPPFTAHRRDATSGGYIGTVKSVAFSPDGAVLATSGGNDKVSLWDTATGAQVRTVPQQPAEAGTPQLTGVVECAISPDGQTVGTISGGKVHFWDITTGDLSTQHQTLANPTGLLIGMAFSPDGATLATGGNDGAIRLWNPHSGEMFVTRGDHRDTVNDVVFSTTHAMLASASNDGTVRLWALAV